MHSERCRRARNRQQRSASLLPKSELAEAHTLAVALSCLVDVSDAYGHRFKPLDRRGLAWPPKSNLAASEVRIPR